MKKRVLIIAAAISLFTLEGRASNSPALDLHFREFNRSVTVLRRQRRGTFQRTLQQVARSISAYNTKAEQKKQVDRQLVVPGQEESFPLLRNQQELADQLGDQYDDLYREITHLFLDAHSIDRPEINFPDIEPAGCDDGTATDPLILHLACGHAPAIHHLGQVSLPPNSNRSAGTINEGELVMESTLGVNFENTIAVDENIKMAFIDQSQSIELTLGFFSCVQAHFNSTGAYHTLFCSSYDLISNQITDSTFREVAIDLGRARLDTISHSNPTFSISYWAARIRQLYVAL